MTTLTKNLLYWLPRVLSIGFILFLSMFALDVFSEQRGFWDTVVGLAMHLIPSFVLVAALVVAWQWEWVGVVMFGGGGMLYIVTVLPNPHLSVAIKLNWCAFIAGPAILIAELFLAGWLKRDEIRGKPR
jgi:hypothetical protein